MKLPNPFKHRTHPEYTSVSLHELVMDLERLSKLREKSIQNSRLYTKEATDYLAEIAMYDRDIASIQRVIEYYQEKITEAHK